MEDGRSYRIFNALDDFNREGLAIMVDLSLPPERVVRALNQIIEWRGKPKQIRCDNGPEYISKLLKNGLINIRYKWFLSSQVQDDILILCKTKRQLSRCRQRMMDVLHERRLSLSRKKSRMGCIKGGFHFLGIDYLPTRTDDNTNISHINDAAITPVNNVHYLNGNRGGGDRF